jgi:hypothetical protein
MVLEHDGTVEQFHSALRADTTSTFTLRKEMEEFQAIMRQDFSKLKEETLRKEQRDQSKIEDLRGELDYWILPLLFPLFSSSFSFGSLLWFYFGLFASSKMFDSSMTFHFLMSFHSARHFDRSTHRERQRMDDLYMYSVYLRLYVRRSQHTYHMYMGRKLPRRECQGVPCWYIFWDLLAACGDPVNFLSS